MSTSLAEVARDLADRVGLGRRRPADHDAVPGPLGGHRLHRDLQDLAVDIHAIAAAAQEQPVPGEALGLVREDAFRLRARTVRAAAAQELEGQPRHTRVLHRRELQVQ
jgi:hypothetical protein